MSTFTPFATWGEASSGRASVGMRVGVSGRSLLRGERLFVNDSTS